jgi:tRNA(adenine34) deaminase
MKQALLEAEKAYEAGEIPVGAVVVCDKKIIARAHNQTELLNDVTAHAEMMAITSATNFLGGKYLRDCEIYITLEPCLMCAGALAWSQIGKVFFAADDQSKGFSKFTDKNIFPSKTIIKGGLLADEAETLLKAFFKELRKK